jgi:hypothetical protein
MAAFRYGSLWKFARAIISLKPRCGSPSYSRQQEETPVDLDPVLLARIQFAFTVTFHIIFPSFTIGLSAYIALSASCGCAPARSAITA